MALIEVRDYHFRSDRIEEYRAWAGVAAPVLRERMDLIGFWIDSGIPPRIMGSEPIDLPYGSANVTWVIRWNDMDHREEVWENLWSDDEWLAVWERHPGFDDYRNMSVRFLEPV